MGVAQGVDEVAGLKTRDLRDHRRQQGVARDVERHAEEHVGGALVELARQPSVRDVELEQAVAGRQRHPVEVGWVPGRDHEAARIRVAADLVEHPGDLVDAAAVGLGPGAPLPAVDGAEVAVRVRPFVPDGDAVGLQRPYVGVAGQEPQQFVDDGA
jgi:hypothetical protein